MEKNKKVNRKDGEGFLLKEAGELNMVAASGIIYARIPTAGSFRQVSINGQDFRRYLLGIYRDKYKESPTAIMLNNVVDYIAYQAVANGVKEGKYRIARVDGDIFYDLGNGSCVKITKDGWSMVDNDLGIFLSNNNNYQQVVPAEGEGDIDLLKKYLGATEEEWFLLLTYIVATFVPDIQHPMLVLIGSQGTGKTMTSRIIKSLVDPPDDDLESVDTSIDNMAVSINAKYYPVLDNVSCLDRKKADFLCQVITGTTVNKRKLYEDTALVSMKLQKPMCINGITDFILRSDLVDRCMFIPTKVLTARKRRGFDDMWKDFERDKPYILAGIFDYLSVALEFAGRIKTKSDWRFTDFEKNCLAVAMARDGDGRKKFKERLEKNFDRRMEISYDRNILIPLIEELMEPDIEAGGGDEWKGTIGSLYRTLGKNLSISNLRDEYDEKQFPKTYGCLGKDLRKLESIFFYRGFAFDFYKNSDGNKCVKITRMGKKNNTHNG